MMFCEKDILQ